MNNNLNEMINKALGETGVPKRIKRTLGYYRYERRRHIDRKKKIIKRVSGVGNDPYWYVKYEGELNKGKIHCSCNICRFHGPSHSDMKKKEKMKYMEKEYDML